MLQLLTLEQLRATHHAGGVLSATLRAEGAKFELQIETVKGTAKLVKSRTKTEVRRFADPRKALLILRDLGIDEAHVDSRHWRPEEQAMERKPRPDRSAVMKAAHAALSYNDWLENKVQAARDGLADGSNASIQPEEWGEIRAAKLAQRNAS